MSRGTAVEIASTSNFFFLLQCVFVLHLVTLLLVFFCVFFFIPRYVHIYCLLEIGWSDVQPGNSRAKLKILYASRRTDVLLSPYHRFSRASRANTKRNWMGRLCKLLSNSRRFNIFPGFSSIISRSSGYSRFPFFFLLFCSFRLVFIASCTSAFRFPRLDYDFSGRG